MDGDRRHRGRDGRPAQPTRHRRRRPACRTAGPVALAAGETALVRFTLPDEATFRALVAEGADIAARSRSTRAVVADIVVSADQLAALRARGATAEQVIQTSSDGARHFADSRRAAGRAAVAAADTLQFLQAYWWTSNGQTFLQTQVATTATDDPDVEITVHLADRRRHHRLLRPVPVRGRGRVPVPRGPAAAGAGAAGAGLTATSSLGGAVPADRRRPPGPARPRRRCRSGYQKDFIDAYMTPIDIQARIRRLARQYPDLVDVIDLPQPHPGLPAHRRRLPRRPGRRGGRGGVGAGSATRT